jgi:SAM-dependent methyltransferase
MSPRLRAPARLRTALRLTRRRLEILLIERRYALPSREEDAPGPLPAHEHHKAFAPTPWRLLSHMLPLDEVKGTDVFVDFGCGSGRLMLEAAERYPFRRLVGVEVVPELAEAARGLLRRNERRLRGSAWEVVTADVLDYEVPDDVTVAYFFDPFTGPVFETVIGKLEASVDRIPRRIRIVYLVPAELASLERSGRVVPVRRGTAGWLRTGGRYDYFIADLAPRTIDQETG